MEEQRLLKKKSQLLKKGDATHLATTCNELADLYMREGQYERSIEEYKNEARLYKELGRRILFAKANRMVGDAYVNLAEFQKALEHQTIHLNVAREEQNELEEQRALASIGRTHLTKGINDFDNTDKESLNLAYTSFLESLKLAERLTDISKQEQMDMRARLLLNIGIVKEHQNDYNAGINYMLNAISICKKYEIYEQLHHTYTTLGSLYSKKGDYSEAIRFYNLACDAAMQMSDKVPALCASLVAKADVLIKTGDYYSAKTVLFKAHKLKMPNVEESRLVEHKLKIVAAMCIAEEALLTVSEKDYKKKKELYEKLGDGECSLKNFSQAIEHYKKMLDNSLKNGDRNKELIPVYVSLAQTYKDNKQFDLAIEYFQKEYELSRNSPVDCYDTLLNIAEVLELANRPYDEIAKVYANARKQAHATGQMKIEGKVIKQFICFLKKSEKLTEVAALETELTEMNYVESESESGESVEGTPNIGEDVNISDITDLSDNADNEDIENQPIVLRKRGKRFTIKKNYKGETQLHTACINGNLILIQHLLDQGHPLNIRDHYGWLPLHEACNYGRLEAVELLLNRGATINDRGGTACNGTTPLHDAALNGHLRVVELLLNRGASPLVQTDDGKTPLDILKTWREDQDLDPSDAALYSCLVGRMQSALEVTGRQVKVLDSNISPKVSAHVIHSPRKQTPKKQTPKKQTPKKETPKKQTPKKRTPRKQTPPKSKIGSLRHSVDINDPLPSTSRYNSDFEYEEESPNRFNLKRSSSERQDSSSGDESKIQKEYRKVMENVRKPLQFDQEIPSRNQSKKTAFLNKNDVGDDWLEDDLSLNQSNKRRKISNKNTLVTTSGLRRSNSISNPNRNGDELQVDDDSNDSNNSRRSRTQWSLLDSGFSRRRSDNSLDLPRTAPVTCVDKISSKTYKRQQKIFAFTLEADSTTTVANAVGESGLTQTVNKSLLGVNVRIENKLWRIPVPVSDLDELTIGWLANEASKRYYKTEGISPTLQLETKEGAILVNEDPLSMMFTAGLQPDEIQSKIIIWNLPPLPERYIEQCTNCKLEVNSVLREHLDECQGTLNLNLDQMLLDKNQFVPLFRSLNRQNNLQHINLTGTALLNEGMQHLCTALPFFVQLRSLNLSLNNITNEGIRYMSDMFLNSTKPILENLNELNLSLNLLDDNCLTYLEKILQRLKLRSLNLSACKFTQNIFEILSNHGINLNLDHLETLDLSYNELNRDSILMFMSFLNFNVATNLNFAHNLHVMESGVAREVAVNLRQFNTVNIRALNLSRCKVNDSEVLDLLRALINAQELDTLDLSYNSDLTSVTLRRLIEHKPSFGSINLEGCTNIVQYLDQCGTNLIMLNTPKCLKLTLNYIKNSKEAENLIIMWEKQWGHKAKIEKMFGSFLLLTIVD